MLVHRLRRWTNIKITGSSRLVYLPGSAHQTRHIDPVLVCLLQRRWPNINLTQDHPIVFCCVIRFGGNMSPAHSNVVTADCTNGPTLSQHFLKGTGPG